VTEVDLASERAITAVLADETPAIPVLGEESGGRTAERYWLVDPLDGTTNFLHAFPVVGVSVALVVGGRPAAGCVHAPFLSETFAAARGSGCFRWSVSDGIPPRTVHVGGRSPAQAIVATGFPFRRKEYLPRYLGMLRQALELFEDLRRPGAASLDLAWSAAGIFDGFFELGLGPWDVAAGGLLVEEAGGRVTDWAGGPDFLSGDVLAGPPAIHEALLQLAADRSSS
jgi:myo-inositol-1(or 4)-monophosphatase